MFCGIGRSADSVSQKCGGDVGSGFQRPASEQGTIDCLATNGFEVYEPFQIALAGFMANLDRRVGSAVCDLQRLLFYSQPSGDAINTESSASVSVHS